jgi:CRP/FNR family cyclic AMP-dependent transcriptional regulator
MKRIKNISQLKLLEILNRIPIFKSLQPTDRSELASMPNLVVFIEKDVTFINRNEHGSTFFILLNGEVNVSTSKKHIATVGPGDFIGEVGFICNETRSASVTTINDVIAMRITSELFEQLPIKVREIIKNKIITGMANRITKQNNKIIELEEKTNVIKVEEINAIKGKEIKQIVFTKVKTSKKSTW